MKILAGSKGQWCTLDDSDAGEGLAIFFGQSSKDIQYWKLDVYATIDAGSNLLVGTIFVSPPTATSPAGPPTRQVGLAVCPGAKSWAVYASPVLATPAGQFTNESANIELVSSPCCTAPAGVSRVGQRYGVVAGTVAAAVIDILPGQVVTRISATGTGAGSVQFQGEPAIPVALNYTLILEPKAQIPAKTITFANVSYVIEFLESA
jgi:hypothetical protein